MEAEDFKNLPTEELCTHKSWKARLLGYNNVLKIFEEIEDEKSSEWNKFSSLLKQSVTDNNIMCQEKGLAIALLFVENSALAGKYVGDVLPEVTQKCLASPKARIRELASKIIAMFVEIEKQTAVLDELLKGMQSKNPRVKSACLQVVKELLMDFGPGVVSVDKLIKNVANLVEDKDKPVRLEARQLLAAIYLWQGENFKQTLLAVLKSTHVADIDAEYERIKGTSVFPTRFQRSQQLKRDASAGNNLGSPKTADALVNNLDADVFESLAPVNILEKVNTSFYNKLESKKWSERRDTLEDFYKLLNDSKKLENADYGELVSALKKIILKDSHILVVSSAIKCLSGISKGLSKNFNQYSNSVMTVLFGKFKEKKQNVIMALREAVDSVYLSTNLDTLQEDILSSLDEKNPSIKAEVASFLKRCFCKRATILTNKKSLKKFTTPLCNMLRDQDPNVRENAAEALGAAMKVVGEKSMRQFLKEIDDLHFKKINEYCDKAEIISPQTCITPREIVSPLIGDNAQPEQLKTLSCKNTVRGLTKIKKETKSVKPKSFPTQKQDKPNYMYNSEQPSRPPIESTQCSQTQKSFNISKLSDSILSDLTNKNWKIRLEAISKLQAVVNSAQSINTNLGGVESIIVERIQDNNHKISERAVELLNSIIRAMGPSSKRYLPVYLPGLMKIIGDARLRSATISCLNSWSKICGIDKFFESPVIVEALKSGSSAAQAEIWTWLTYHLVIPAKKIPEECVTVFLGPLYLHLKCKHPDVRKRASDAAVALMAHIGYEKMTISLKNMDLTKSSVISIMNVLEKARNNLPVKSLIQEDKKDKLSSKKSASDNTAPIEMPRENKEISVHPFMLQESNLKAQRIINQEKFKLNCKMAKGEVMEELKNLMINDKVNPVLVSDMFHPSDFRIRLRALEKLYEELSSNKEGLKSNLDLILRWIELNNFEKNPSFVLKELQFLKKVFEILKEEEYNLLDCEARNILPHLIQKLGDSKETVRHIANEILKLIAHIYPPKKQFPVLAEGLKSKSVQEKLECIAHLAWLIVEFEIKVRHQTLAQILKRIAMLLEEKDPTVRKAALNFFVQTCSHEGENVLNGMNFISDKSMRTLKEKLEYQSKISMNKNLKKCKALETIQSSNDNVPFTDSQNNEFFHQVLNDSNDLENNESQSRPTESETVKETTENHETYMFHTPKLKEINLQFMTNLTPVKYIETAKNFHSASMNLIKLTEKGEDLLKHITNNADRGITLVENLRPDEIPERKFEIDSILDRLITNFVQLIEELKNLNHPGVVCYYNASFSILRKMIDNPKVCLRISEDNLIKLFEELLLLQKDRKPEDSLNTFTRSINALVISLLENSNQSATICALLKILIVNRTEASESFNQLVAKCFWKLDTTVFNWYSDQDLNKILLLINTFLNTYPKTISATVTVQSHLKTVQNLLRKMINERGADIFKIVDNWSHISTDSEIVQLIKKFSNDLEKDTKAAENKKLCDNPNKGESSDGDQRNWIEKNRQFSRTQKSSSAEKIKISYQTKELWMRLNSLKEKLGLQTETSQGELDDRLKEIYAHTSMDSSDYTSEQELKSRIRKIQSFVGT